MDASTTAAQLVAPNLCTHLTWPNLPLEAEPTLALYAPALGRFATYAPILLTLQMLQDFWHHRRQAPGRYDSPTTPASELSAQAIAAYPPDLLVGPACLLLVAGRNQDVSYAADNLPPGVTRRLGGQVMRDLIDHVRLTFNAAFGMWTPDRVAQHIHRIEDLKEVSGYYAVELYVERLRAMASDARLLGRGPRGPGATS